LESITHWSPRFSRRVRGLAYPMAEAGLMPDDRLVDWVLAMAQG
jgi:hypothetical protein